MTDTLRENLIRRGHPMSTGGGGLFNPDGPEAVAELDRLSRQLAERDAELARMRNLVRRYRVETPLGHQPHMIAHEADATLGSGSGSDGWPVPEGYALVPIEPSKEMLMALFMSGYVGMERYRAMLAAAPAIAKEGR